MALAPIGGEPDDHGGPTGTPALSPHTAVHVARARLAATGEAAAVIFQQGRPVGVVTADALAEPGTTSQQDAPISTVMDYVAVRVTQGPAHTRPCGRSPTPPGTGSSCAGPPSAFDVCADRHPRGGSTAVLPGDRRSSAGPWVRAGLAAGRGDDESVEEVAPADAVLRQFFGRQVPMNELEHRAGAVWA